MLASNERVDCISLINDVNTQNIAIVIIVIVKTDDGDKLYYIPSDSDDNYDMRVSLEL